MNGTGERTKTKARIGIKIGIKPEVKPEDQCKFTQLGWKCKLHRFGKSEYCFHHLCEETDDEEVWKVEVIADNTNKWSGNSLRFKTAEAAEEYGEDLARRWTLLRHWRVASEWRKKERKEDEGA